MQTFLPYPSFDQSAKVLDYKRLGKQRVEAMQILNVLEGHQSHWANHPAVKMWQGYDNALRMYLTVMIREWRNRGYVNNIPLPQNFRVTEWPHWLGSPDFHASHRSNLLRKYPEFYSKYGWKEPNNLPYVWPKGKP